MNISISELVLACLTLPAISAIGLLACHCVHQLAGLIQDAQEDRPPAWQEEELVRVPAYSSSCRVFPRSKPGTYN